MILLALAGSVCHGDSGSPAVVFDDVRKSFATPTPGLGAIDAFVSNQVKLAVIPMIIKTIESFLHQESMLLALFRGLELVNKGVREETELLDATQMAELRRERKKAAEDRVTPNEVQHKVDQIHSGLKKEMAAVLKRILETAANPMIDSKIDQFAND